MKICRLISALVVVNVLLLAGSGRAATPAGARLSLLDAPQQTEAFSKTVPLAKGGTFELSNIAGDIVITGGSGDHVIIAAVKKGRTAEELKEVTIEVTAAANRVEVRTRYPERRGSNSVSVDYTVTVPRGAALIVRSISGDEKVSAVDGEMHLNSISGNVTVASAADVRAVKSISGNVHVQASKSTGALSASSVSGNVKLMDVRASELEVNSISGNVTCDQIVTPRAALKSVSGNITFGGPLAKGGRYELTSHSGDVSIVVSDKMGIELSASTFSGEVTSDLALTPKAGGDSTRGRGRRMRQTLQGTFGDGSAVLQVTSFSGDIKIVKK
ncbi:MAG: DUF4097 family beta strand repeat-containing protein [Acidobacteria bacterium]|nr:DUF4097 family beta strand repeat-containing protein [Acidobacteriota bacterium]